MGLLQKLKSALGLDGSNSPSGTAGDVDVTVEREPSTEDEDAVKGTDTSTTRADEADSGTAGGEVPTESGGEKPDAGAETEIPDAESEPEPTDSESDAADAEPAGSEPDTTAPTDEGSGDPVTEIKGIGPAYGDRLAAIGIDTVGDLAAADAADVAAETDIAESRVEGWVEQAAEY